MTAEAATFLAAAFSVALFHAISPDHWLPFVMVGRSQRWPIMKTELVALAAGIGHVGTSVTIALVGIFIGAELSERFAEIAETATGSALIIFGLGYAIYSWCKGGHVHFTVGGDRLTDGYSHLHADQHSAHSHDKLGRGHDHVHETNLPKGDKAPYTLVAIMGLTPCVALLPLAFAAASHGTGVVLGVIAVFSVSTIIAILILTFLGSRGLSLMRLSWFEKHGDIITGFVIGCIGLMTMFLGL